MSRFIYDPEATSTEEVSAAPSTFVYNPDTGEHAVDADEFSRLSDAKLVKENAFTPSENKFGALGSFAADVFVSPAVGVKENLADNVKYYLGNTLVAIPRTIRFGNPIGAALGDLTGLNERTTTLGQHLADTETVLRLKKRDEARTQRFENMGYEMDTLAGIAGKAVTQGIGQAMTMAVAPGLKEPMLMAQAAEAYKAKMTELAVEGEDANLTDYMRASGSAILAYGIERIGLDAMTGYFKPLAERTFRSFAGRVAQGALGEGAESAIQSVGEQSMDIGFGLKMPEDFSIQSVALEGVMGLIGGGAGGLAYASAARKKIATAYQDVLKYNGHEIPFNDALDLAEQTLSGVSFDMSQYIRQHASIDQSKIDSVEAYHAALTKRPVNAEGIAPEDIERVANRKRDFDAIVDSVTAQKEQYVEEYAMTAEDPMVEEARKYKTADEFVKVFSGVEKSPQKEVETEIYVDENVSETADEKEVMYHGNRGEDIKVLSGETSNKYGHGVYVSPSKDVARTYSSDDKNIHRLAVTVKNPFVLDPRPGDELPKTTRTAVAGSDPITGSYRFKLVEEVDQRAIFKKEYGPAPLPHQFTEGGYQDLTKDDVDVAEALKKIGVTKEAVLAMPEWKGKRAWFEYWVSFFDKSNSKTATEKARQLVEYFGYDAIYARQGNREEYNVFNEKDIRKLDYTKRVKQTRKETVPAELWNQETLTDIWNKATEKKKTLRSTGFSETAPEVAMKVKSLDSEITTKLNAIAALERKGDPVATKLKANLDKQLKDMGLLQEQAAELQRLAIESRPDSDVTMDATMQASVKHMDTAMDNVSKKISETMNAIETAEVEKQLDLNDRLDELTEQYAELEQERKDILNGVVKPEGRIVTTAAKVRQIRYAQASTSLRNIMAARKATKQELASAYNAVKRAIKSTKLPRDVKNQLISDYAKAQSYEDLYTVYPKIQAAIDEALQAEKARLGRAWLARGIRQLVNNRFAEERAIGKALQAVFTQSGPAKSINSLVDKYVASVNHAVTLGQNNAQYMIDLARDLQLFIMQGSAGREAQAKAEVERRARVQEIFEKSLKARKAEAKARKQKKARGTAPLVPGAEDITDAPVEYSLGINDLYRSLMTIGADVQKLFNNSKPHFTLIQNRMRANETFSKLVEDAYGLKGAKLNEALDADMRDNFIMLPAFDYEKPIDTNGVITYPKIEQRISHATARSVWAMTRNSDVRYDLTHGKDDKAQLQEDAVQKIEQWINDPKNERHKKIAEGEMAMLEDYARRIQALYAEVFPEEYFDPIESYFMTARIFSGEDLAFVLPSDSMMPSQMQTKKFVGALQKRTGGQLLFKLQPDVINMRKYVNTMEHFLAYAKYVKELKQAVNDSRGTLTDVFGEKWLKRLDQQIDFLRDGGAIAHLVNPESILAKLYTNVARVLVRAPTQYIKQRMGFFTANVNFAYASEAFSKADEAIIAGKSSDTLMQLIMSMSAIDDRYGSSENYGLLQTEIGQTRKTHKETAKKHFFDRLFNTFPRLGDKHAYLSVAYAKAKEMYDKGAHPSTAVAAGIEEADTSQMTLDLARQSTWTIEQSRTGNPMLRSVMALSSATTQMFNRYWSNLTDGFNMYQSGKKKEGVEKMASTIVKWHFLVGLTYSIAASGATAEVKEYLRRILLGPAGDLPIIGGVYNSSYSMLTAIYDKVTGAEGGEKITPKTFLESNLLGSVIAQVSKQVNDIVEAEDEGNPVWVEAAEAAALIYAISTGFPAQELAKISASVYDNTNNAEQGAYPWMLALSGYTRKQVEKAREAQ